MDGGLIKYNCMKILQNIYFDDRTIFEGSEISINEDKIVDSIISNLKIINENLRSDAETVEGDQTDVDDFDMHRVRFLSGSVICESFVPKSLLTDVDSSDEGISEFFDNIVSLPDMHELITGKIAELSDFDGGLMSELSISKGDNITCLVDFGKSDGDVVYLSIINHVNRSDKVGRSNLVSKGGYRTGGRYPDA